MIYTVQSLAATAVVRESLVCQAIKNGDLAAEKIGGKWLINERDGKLFIARKTFAKLGNRRSKVTDETVRLNNLVSAILLKEFGGVVKELPFHPSRKWRFDYAVPAVRIAVEVEGGVYSRGRHTRGTGYQNDIEKYNAALLLGWRVYRVTYQQIKSGYFSELVGKIKRAVTA